MYKKLVSALIAATLLFVDGIVQADDKQLPEVVVTATRTETPLTEVPASVGVVTKKDFELEQAPDVADVMRKLPGVDFPGGPRSNSEIPTIRGLKGPEITLLVDGARQNDWVRGGIDTPLFIDPYFLGRAEVLRGSGSSLYGPGGIGGVMSFTTLSALDLLSPGQTFGTGVRVGGASANNAKDLNARIYGANGMFDALIAVGHHGWQHIRQGGGTYQEPNDGDSNTSLIKVGMQASSNLRFELSNTSYRSGTLEPINPLIDWTVLPHVLQLQYDNISHDQTVLKGTMTDASGSPMLIASGYRSNTEQRSDPGPGTTNFINTGTDTDGFSVQGIRSIDGGMAGVHRLTAGIDYYKDTQTAFGSGNANPNGDRAVYGVYLQDQIALWKSWQLIPGVRYDHYTNDPDTITSLAQSYAIPASSTTNQHTSPKVTLAWEPLGGLQLYASWAEAFRAPTLGEMYLSNTAASCAQIGGCFRQFAANPNLRPETDRTKEVGFNFNRDRIFTGADNMMLRVSAFDSDLSDMITSVRIAPCPLCTSPVFLRGVFQSQNLQSANRKGGEAQLDYTQGPWQATIAYGRVRVTNTTPGTTAANADIFSPPDKVTTQLTYHFARPDLTLRWNMMAVAAQDYDSTVSARRPGYTVHDVFAQWVINRYASLNFGVSNLSDRRYARYSGSTQANSYIYEAGRSIMAALSLSY